MKRILFIVLSLLFLSVSAQETGSIVGKIVDSEAGDEALPFATIIIEGTTTGTTSDFDGLFAIANLPAGPYNLQISSVGYETVTLTDLIVEPGKALEVNIPMSTGSVDLEAVVVTSKVETESEIALLVLQKKSVEMKESIGAQELSRKGVSNAEAAVTKISGVSKQQGVKNVFVRGLGDRYNSTSLNNLPLPSEDPEYKNITLDFFSSDIINSIDVNKSFNHHLYGDEAGANVNIFSKRLDDDRLLEVGVSTGVNSQAISTSTFIQPAESNFLGITNRENPISDLNTYSFGNSLDASANNSPINLGFNIAAGKKFKVGSNDLSVFVVGASTNDYSYREGKARGAVNGLGQSGKDWNYEKYIASKNQILMGNFRLDLAGQNYLALNSLFIHDNTASVGDYRGENIQNISELDDRTAYLRRQQVNDNALYVNQLIGHFELTDKIVSEAGVSYNLVQGSEPDRRTNTFVRMKETGEYRNTSGSAGVNHRFFSELTENDIAGYLKFDYRFLGDENNSKIQLGYNYRNTNREFLWRQFGHDFSTQSTVDINNLDGSLFNQQSINDGTFALVTNWGRGGSFNVLRPESYNGDKTIHAPYASLTYEFNQRLTLNMGLRYEMIDQEVTWDTGQLPNTFGQNLAATNPTYLLPSFTLKANITENDIVRLAGSKTYTFPQFKELAPFLYEDVNFFSFGNPDLVPAQNYNLDLKYEKYFSRGEVISFTGFYKYVDNAINRALVVSAANELSYVNTGEATAAGVEMELRKSLFQGETRNGYHTLNAGVNFSYLHTDSKLVDVDTDALDVEFTNSSSQLEGASPILLNADLTYSIDKDGEPKFLSTAVVNYFSSRVFAFGTLGRENFVEKGIPTFDIISKFHLDSKSTIGLNLKNLLNPTYKISMDTAEGEDFIIEDYQLGMNVSLSYSFKF
ncbi:MAG: TonB-dependent receptor [Cyclobacteriaceae bacterium]